MTPCTGDCNGNQHSRHCLEDQLRAANLQISEATIKERDRILEILEGCHENCTGACGACLAEQRIRVPLKPK